MTVLFINGKSKRTATNLKQQFKRCDDSKL